MQQIGNDVVVSGLESAMSLIQTARNLLGAVVLTVKAAYIASTKVSNLSWCGVVLCWLLHKQGVNFLVHIVIRYSTHILVCLCTLMVQRVLGSASKR